MQLNVLIMTTDCILGMIAWNIILYHNGVLYTLMQSPLGFTTGTSVPVHCHVDPAIDRHGEPHIVRVGVDGI